MDAERLAAIRKGAEDYRGGDHGWETYWYASGYILELCDHIDALEAENEQLRDSIDTQNVQLAENVQIADALQARVTLLGGLLAQAGSDLAESSGYETSDGGLDFLLEIDAALSPSDAATEASPQSSATPTSRSPR